MERDDQAAPEQEVVDDDLSVLEADAEAQDEAGQKPQADPADLELARKYGWRPLEEYTRDPKGWVDADRFLELGSTQAKILRDTKRELEAKLADSERQRAEEVRRLEAMAREGIDRARKQERADFDRRLADLAARQRAAVETGDTRTFDALERERQQMRPPTQDDGQQPGADPAAAKYLAETPWVQNADAKAYGAYLIEQNPHIKALPAMDQIRWAEERVKVAYPALFQSSEPASVPAAPKRQMVDGGGLGTTRRASAAGKLPPDAKAQGQEFVKEGLFKSLEEYAQSYFEQE